MRHRILLLLAFALLAAAPAPALPLLHSVAGWTVACDNVATCEALAFADGGPSSVHIIQDAGPAGPTILLSMPRIDPTRIRLDDEATPLLAPDWLSDYAGNTLSTTRRAPALAFIARLLRSRHLSPNDDPRAAIPLDGLTDALRLIDEVQHRAGTTAAFVAPRGTAPLPPAAAPPPRPVWRRPGSLSTAQALHLAAIARADPAVIAARAAAGCTLKAVGSAHALDGAHALILLPCRPDPEESSTAAILPRMPGGPAALFTPALPAGLPQSGPATIPHAFFIRGSGELSAFTLGSPDAGGGYGASWIWSAGAFRLASLTGLDRCGGATSGHWPTLYRTAPAAP